MKCDIPSSPWCPNTQSLSIYLALERKAAQGQLSCRWWAAGRTSFVWQGGRPRVVPNPAPGSIRVTVLLYLSAQTGLSSFFGWRIFSARYPGKHILLHKEKPITDCLPKGCFIVNPLGCDRGGPLSSSGPRSSAAPLRVKSGPLDTLRPGRGWCTW